jgi:hypothetical protein
MRCVRGTLERSNHAVDNIQPDWSEDEIFDMEVSFEWVCVSAWVQRNVGRMLFQRLLKEGVAHFQVMLNTKFENFICI